MVKTETPWWFREFKEAMKGWGLGVIICIAIGAWIWGYSGEILENNRREWTQFTTEVRTEHRAHAEILREISTILRAVCEKVESGKNLQTTHDGSGG